MSFRVVIDSCGELTDEMKKSGNFVSAPLTLQVDEYIVQDDEEHFNQAEFLKKVAECPIVRNLPAHHRKYIVMPTTVMQIMFMQ